MITLLIFWILAYSIIGADILLSLVFYFQTSNKISKNVAYIFINLLCIVFISGAQLVGLLPIGLFHFLLLISLSLLNLSISFLLYSYEQVCYPKGKINLFLGFLFISLFLLFWLKPQGLPILYFIWWIPFPLFGIDLNYKCKQRDKRDKKNFNSFKRDKAFELAMRITGILAFIMIVGAFFIFLKGSLNRRISLYFAIMYFFYGIPFLVYLIYGLCLNKNSAKQNSLKPFDCLSQREKEVALLIVKGLKYQTIGETLFISLSTVKKHANNIYKKTGTHNGRELTALYLKNSTSRP